MSFFSADIRTLDDLFLHQLRDIYYAEQRIAKSLPDMIDKADNADLKRAFESHLEETRGHVERLERVFDSIGKRVEGVDCPAIDGVIDEANEIFGEITDGEVLDAALAAAAQTVEHYEMSRYGTLIAWAKELGKHDCAELLQQTLEEEKAADKTLTEIAEERLNKAG